MILLPLTALLTIENGYWKYYYLSNKYLMAWDNILVSRRFVTQTSQYNWYSYIKNYMKMEA